MNFLDLIWLIPLVPLFGAAVMLFFGRRLPKAAISIICPGAVGVSLLLSVGAVIQLAGLKEKIHQVTLFSWLPLMKSGHGLPAGSAQLGDDPGGDRRRVPDPRVFDRLH